MLLSYLRISKALGRQNLIKSYWTYEIFVLFDHFSWYISSLNSFLKFSSPNSVKESFKAWKWTENIVVYLMVSVISVMLWWSLNLFIAISTSRACPREVGHACGMEKKGHFLVNLGQFKHETSLNSIQISTFWSDKMSKKNSKRALRRVLHATKV